MQVAEYSRKRVVAAMHAVEAELEKSDYITGPAYSGADVMLAGAVRGALVRTSHWCLGLRLHPAPIL
jgi:glutathione S-transferase